jgi:acetyl-CoA synthetase
VRAPWIGMTAGFWRDAERYEEPTGRASRACGSTATGPPSTRTASWYILGRSDDTIKIAGKRLGPAEGRVGARRARRRRGSGRYRDTRRDEGTGARLLLCDQAGWTGTRDASLTDALAAHVAARLGKPLRPARVAIVTELPKTRNGKVMRRVIRAAYLGTPPGDLSSLERAGSIDAISRGGHRPSG